MLFENLKESTENRKMIISKGNRVLSHQEELFSIQFLPSLCFCFLSMFMILIKYIILFYDIFGCMVIKNKWKFFLLKKKIVLYCVNS
jgi:hypothetical protein